jgi:hypothetical protein
LLGGLGLRRAVCGEGCVLAGLFRKGVQEEGCRNGDLVLGNVG